jgi:hypothetical protein
MESWAESSVEILTQMDQEWGFYQHSDLKRFASEELAEEEIETLPEPYRSDARAKRTRRIREEKAARENNEFVDTVHRVIQEHNTSIITIGRGHYAREVPLAWELLCERRDYEYEKVDLETIWNYQDEQKHATA